MRCACKAVGSISGLENQSGQSIIRVKRTCRTSPSKGDTSAFDGDFVAPIFTAGNGVGGGAPFYKTDLLSMATGPDVDGQVHAPRASFKGGLSVPVHPAAKN